MALTPRGYKIFYWKIRCPDTRSSRGTTGGREGGEEKKNSARASPPPRAFPSYPQQRTLAYPTRQPLFREIKCSLSPLSSSLTLSRLYSFILPDIALNFVSHFNWTFALLSLFSSLSNDPLFFSIQRPTCLYRYLFHPDHYCCSYNCAWESGGSTTLQINRQTRI